MPDSQPRGQSAAQGPAPSLGTAAFARAVPPSGAADAAGGVLAAGRIRPLIDIQLLALCLLMPPAGSYAIKYVYGGPHAADFTTLDLCLNLMLTLLGFVPGQLHAVYLLARHKRWRMALEVELLVLQLLLLLAETAGLRVPQRVADWERPQRQTQQGQEAPYVLTDGGPLLDADDDALRGDGGSQPPQVPDGGQHGPSPPQSPPSPPSPRQLLLLRRQQLADGHGTPSNTSQLPHVTNLSRCNQNRRLPRSTSGRVPAVLSGAEGDPAGAGDGADGPAQLA